MSGVTILMLPGMDGTGELFAPFAASLPSIHEPVVMSYSCDEPQHYDQLERLARAKIDEIGGPVLLLGESYSGPIAVRIAAAPPPKLRAVVLVATFLRSPVCTCIRPLARPFIFKRPPSIFVIRHLLVGTDGGNQIAQDVRAAVSVVAPRVMASRARDILSVDVKADFASIDLPMLFLVGTRDRLVKSKREVLQDLNPKVQWAEIDAPHLVLQVAPKAASEVICQFIDSVND